MAPSKKYENVEMSIHKILKEKVTVSDTEKKRANKCLNEIFDVLESKMRKNSAFNALFRQKQYVGSYYENLKIDEPDEFDIDFELRVPSYIGELEVCESEQPGFCQLKLHQDSSPVSDPQKAEARKQVNKWTDYEGFLSRNKVNQWMQSVVDKALDEYQQNNEQKTFEFARSCSGPAVTLSVTLIEHPELCISLDFVPVFVFEEWPTLENLRKWEPEMEVQKWYAVPKSNDNYKDFRLCFWHQEKYLLRDTNQMKSVLKLIKKLRDIQQWSGICSYYIKTMFLWKTSKCGKSYWCKGAAANFIEMLNELKHYLLIHNALPFFWMAENDLFSRLKLKEKQNIGGYLGNMINDIEKNLDKPQFLEKFFNPPNRFPSFEEDSENNISWVTPISSRFPSFEEDSEDDISWVTPISSRLQCFEEDSEDEVGWVTPISSRPVNQHSQLPTHQQESNTGIIAAVAIGAAALFTVGLFTHIFSDTKRARE